VSNVSKQNVGIKWM